MGIASLNPSYGLAAYESAAPSWFRNPIAGQSRASLVSGSYEAGTNCRHRGANVALKSHSLTWYCLNGVGSAAILLGSFFITIRLIDAADVLDYARRGRRVDITFDAAVC